MRSAALALFATMLLAPAAVGQSPPTKPDAAKPTVGGTAPTKKRYEDMTPDEQKAANEETMAKATAGAMPLVVIVLLAVAGIVFTFAPAAIAIARGHNNWLPIFLLCLFLGWSCIGWLAALIWSFSSDTKSMDVRRFGRRYD